MKSLRRRAVALMMIRADADHWHDSEYRDGINRAVDSGVGGVGVFAGQLEETADMIANLQKRSGNRLLIAADYEFGLPMRLAGGVAFPRAMALGKLDPSVTETVAAAIAVEARAIGVHWNWAPCADVNSNPRNPIINTRAFGEDPGIVAKHAAAFVIGTQRNGVIACAKHVPGHGDTFVDSHLAIPRIDIDFAKANDREFIPFKKCINAGVGSLMMGHIILSCLDGEWPASLSLKIINDLVRRDWGYDGLITTDALDMSSIAERYESGSVAVRAIVAGADIALMPSDTNAAIRSLMKAVDDGIITEERVTEAERRRKTAESIISSGGTIPVDQASHANVALKAADAAIQIIGDANLLPLEKYKQVAAFAFVDDKEVNTATTFFRYLAEATEIDIDFGFVDGSISDRDLAGLLEGIEKSECILFAFFGTAVSFRGTLPNMNNIPEIMNRLSGSRKRIVISCGSPYETNELKSELTINTFSETIPSLAATVLRLIGRKPG